MLPQILIVSDDPDVLSGYQRVLGSDHDIDIALGVERGLRELEKHDSFRVVISDMQMEDMNGAEFLTHVRSHFPHVIRILCTKHRHLENPVYAINKGHVFRVLEKPFSREILNRVIDDALEYYYLKNIELEYLRQINAIDRSQAVIELSMDGTILIANEHYLKAMRYSSDELQAQPYEILLDTDFAQSSEYKTLWEDLYNGQPRSGLFKQIDKFGREVWLQATFTPYLELNQKPYKIVQYAVDVTDQRLQDNYYQAQIEAIGNAQAVIEFNTDGTIITANSTFLETMGYSLYEIQGHHHSIFVDFNYQNRREYNEFWNQLREGKSKTSQFKRIGKNGKEVWIQATYIPILGFDHTPFRIIKYATDITEKKLQSAYFKGQIEALHKALAVIEFNMDGTILKANDNFLKTVEYTLEEIQGKHHSLFVDKEHKESKEYKAFWDTLRQGTYSSGLFKRINKSGDEIWIQASYNPILDLNNIPFKIVKYATDVTIQIKNIERVAENAELLSTSSDEVADISTHLSEHADDISSQVQLVNSLAEQVSLSIHSVADAAREMSTSIDGVASSAKGAAEVASNAVTAAHDTNELVEKLGESSRKISSVIKVITSIANQTNLLALNATIEAARAGELGKGFAVVASEVKELAKQTEKATKEVSTMVTDIQEDTLQAVTGINQISKIITQIDEIQASIVVAVDKQTQATAEIAHNVKRAASSSNEIAGKISTIADGAQKTRADATDSMEAAKKLASMAETLQQVVAQFEF